MLALDVRTASCPTPVSRQTLTDCILAKKKKKKQISKATLPNPWAFRRETLLHSFTMSEGAHNRLCEESVVVQTVGLSAYIMSTSQRWTHICIHTVHNVQSIRWLFLFICHEHHCSTSYLVDSVFVYNKFKYIYSIYVYSIPFSSHKKMHCVLLRQRHVSKDFVGEDGWYFRF